MNMSQEDRKILANNLKKLRLAHNIKREQLSLALGFDNSYISKLERCTINITLDKLTLIAKYFKIPTCDLLKP